MSGKGSAAPAKGWRERLLPLLFWLLVWECAALWAGRRSLLEAWTAWRQAGDAAGLLRCLWEGQTFVLPAPPRVAQELLALAGPAYFWRTAALSLCRVFAGAAIGVAAGAALAAGTAAARWARLLFAPAVKVVRAAPVASFIILVLLWAERNWVPVIIAALMVLPVVWGNVAQGVDATDGGLLELSRAYGFSRWRRVRLVYVPSVLPYFAAACRTSLGLAWKAGVAAEVLCLPRLAIGTQVSNAKTYLDTPGLFAWTLTVLLLSFALERVLGGLLGRLERGRGGSDCAGDP